MGPVTPGKAREALVSEPTVTGNARCAHGGATAAEARSERSVSLGAGIRGTAYTNR